MKNKYLRIWSLLRKHCHFPEDSCCKTWRKILLHQFLLSLDKSWTLSKNCFWSKYPGSWCWLQYAKPGIIANVFPLPSSSHSFKSWWFYCDTFLSVLQVPFKWTNRHPFHCWLQVLSSKLLQLSEKLLLCLLATARQSPKWLVCFSP